MEQIIDKVLEIYRLKHEINTAVKTCEVCSTDTRSWHIFGYESFVKVARALNVSKFSEIDAGYGPFRWRYEFECRGVTVFCLSDERQAVTIDG